MRSTVNGPVEEDTRIEKGNSNRKSAMRFLLSVKVFILSNATTKAQARLHGR